ncbi:hypothetical protein ACKAV7_004277 [Fusarium commune]|uniref:Cyanovirin-N domain-containing protein n=1 Tax=Fusarium oxysporum f. sp. rapae TaxID=485398 RepID=A0A8J5P348_FUSOX|nr:hypothetical protein Forpe1208_v002353 [Fusarium oxysporum f. sp. rapae]
MRFPIFTSIVFTLTTHSATAYKPWNGTIPESVNEECRQALSTDIDCPFVLGRDSVESGLYLKDPALSASYCSSSCRSSLRQYFLDFSRACYKETLLEGVAGLDATADYALSLFGTQEYLCVADEDGPCLGAFYKEERDFCSECGLKLAGISAMFEFRKPLNIGPNKYMCLQENCAKDKNSFLSKDDGKAKLDKFFKELISGGF